MSSIYPLSPCVQYLFQHTTSPRLSSTVLDLISARSARQCSICLFSFSWDINSSAVVAFRCCYYYYQHATRRVRERSSSLSLFDAVTMATTTRSNRIMSTSSSSTIHDALITAWDHPRTMILGGLIIYFVGGLTFIQDPKSRKVYFRPITTITKGILSIVGFASALVWDIQDAYNDGRTQLWKQGLDSLKLFLKESGLDSEFSTTMKSTHFLTSTIVLTDLQNKVQRQRRSQLKHHHHHASAQQPSTTIRSRDIVDETTISDDDDNQKKKAVLEQDLIDGQHYMRFATAVYGEEMMAGAELAVKGETNIIPTIDSNNTCIIKHCQLRRQQSGGEPSTTDKTTTTTTNTTVADVDDDEIWCDYDYDFSTAKHPHAQNCMVIARPNEQEIILSIRGTFSLSGIITDLAGYCEPYCNGMAHSGMASASKDTWDTVWDQIIKPKLEEEENNNKKNKIKYNRLTVTGHSLGAGVACLVTIFIYHQQLSELKDYKIKCYAMAPPPVFCPLEKAPNAVANTIAYINNYDIVPSLSVDAIRRLMACLDRIVTVLQSNPYWDLAAKRWHLGEPQPELLDAYHPKSPLDEVSKAPMVLIPASKIIWMEKDPTLSSDKIVYEAHSLCPTKYADRVLDLELPDCVSDHMSDCYEVAFDHLVVQK